FFGVGRWVWRQLFADRLAVAGKDRLGPSTRGNKTTPNPRFVHRQPRYHCGRAAFRAFFCLRSCRAAATKCSLTTRGRETGCEMAMMRHDRRLIWMTGQGVERTWPGNLQTRCPVNDKIVANHKTGLIRGEPEDSVGHF